MKSFFPDVVLPFNRKRKIVKSSILKFESDLLKQWVLNPVNVIINKLSIINNVSSFRYKYLPKFPVYFWKKSIDILIVFILFSPTFL